MITRRALTLAAAAAALPACAGSQAGPGPAQAAALADLEARAGGRLGVFAIAPATGASFGHRADERFGMCSTVKLPLAGLILREVEAGRLSLDKRLAFGPGDMVSMAPVAQTYLDRGWITVEEAARAAQMTSDNVAANLLIALLGGPEGVTAGLRQAPFGARAIRLDRLEPEMNLVPPGDPRDTTTPRDMAGIAATLCLGDAALPLELRGHLIRWMVATETGRTRLRAGLPPDWRAGDKTGTGLQPMMPNKNNDVAVVWPPGRPPFALAAYYEAPVRTENTRPQDNAVLAEVGRIAAAWAVG
jgi:beta-lactamase class A